MTRINLEDPDLEANRQGQLSARQRRMIRTWRRVWVLGTAGLGLIALLLGAALLLKLLRPDFAGRGELVLAIPLLLFWAWLLREMPRRWRQANQDLADGRVVVHEGAIQKEIDFGLGLLRSTRHYVHVDGTRFHVPGEQYRAFEEGRRYHVYHTPHGRQLLGALPLVEPAPAAAAGAPARLVEPLTAREQEVLALIAEGLSNRQIADQLSLSVNTIKMYASQLYQKLGVSRRTEAVARARELHLL